MSDPHVLLLDDRDNVLVARKRIPAGVAVVFEGAAVIMTRDIPLGHKIARRPIEAGAKILKYGAPIGRATEAIAAGAHVHVHNVASDYTKTHYLTEVEIAAEPGA